jgi:hypothetical protein
MIVDLQPAFGQLDHKAAQCKFPFLAPAEEPVAVFVTDCPAPMPANPARLQLARFAKQAHPSCHRFRGNTEPCRDIPARQSVPLNSPNYAFAKIKRIRLHGSIFSSLVSASMPPRTHATARKHFRRRIINNQYLLLQYLLIISAISRPYIVREYLACPISLSPDMYPFFFNL